MTTNQAIETKRSVYDTCDPQYLRALREAAGMDLFVLARISCLSIAQVRQLETDASDGFFYSDAIKRQAYKRLLMILGAEPPTVELPEALRDAAQVADAHLATLDQIVAMSEQPSLQRSSSDLVRAGFAKLNGHKQALGALLLLVIAVVLFLLNSPQNSGEAAATPTTPSPVQPVPISSAAELPPAVVVPAASTPVIPASAPAVAATAVVAPVVAASANTVTQAGACAYSSEAMPQLTPFTAHKEGRYVYLVSNANAEICVVDGNKQATVLQLKAGENRSVYGVSPWQVSSANLQKLQIYFQGGRVSLPDTAVNQVKLVEMPVTR